MSNQTTEIKATLNTKAADAAMQAFLKKYSTMAINPKIKLTLEGGDPFKNLPQSSAAAGQQAAKQFGSSFTGALDNVLGRVGKINSIWNTADAFRKGPKQSFD